jgi:hypothetical protein
VSDRAARVACSVTLRAEFWQALGGPEDRLREESGTRLRTAEKNSASLETGAPLALLDEEGRALGQEQPSRARPVVVLTDVPPLRWALLKNTFRKADTFKARFPLALLPVHPSAIRSVTCVVRLRAMSADAWTRGIVGGERGPGGALVSQPTTGASDEDADFVGVAIDVTSEVTDKRVPTFELSFQDYVGLLGTKKVRPGLEFDESIPVSESIAQFLVGSPAEGLRVVWVDAADEPDFGRYRPKLHKVKKTAAKTSTRPAQSKENYLDAISHACSLLGVVPRIIGPRLELAFAGTMYEGRSETRKVHEALLMTNVVRSLTCKHALLGAKTRPIQVVSFDPDTHRQHTARWPPASGQNAALSASKGPLPKLPFVAANVGIPGFEQLDEAIELVPVAPVSDPSILPRMAEAVFLEKNRQRVRYELTTDSPWADPNAPDALGGNLLRLQAGDVVTFGVGTVTAGAGGRALAGVRALCGELDEAGARAELEASGVAPDVAEKVARAIVGTPKTDVFRVDELEVSSSDGEAATLRIALVTYTTIVLDAQTRAKAPAGGPPAAAQAVATGLAGAKTRDEVRTVAQAARTSVQTESTLPPEQEAALLRQMDALEREALKDK